MIDLAQPIINGLLLGGLYAVIALGLSTIFGIVRVVNLAHGDMVILGSYLSLAFCMWLGLNPLWTILLVAPIMFCVGFLIQSVLFNRVLGKGMEPPLLMAFGISIIVQNFLLLVFTSDARALKSDLSMMTISLGEINISLLYLLNFLIGLAVILGLRQFFRKTFLGRAIRAASDDVVAAKLVGANTSSIYAYAMGIAALTAAVAGVLVGMTFIFYPHTGPQYLIIAFGVVIIGGLGSIKGTLVGGFILAMAQLLGAHFFGPGYQLLCGYMVLLIVLAIRPNGIFGKA
ncbi:MAG: branched-chain amino acid ABC transporter permease [Proteobacteria bacterium]|nr:branched-chain amino acid ABC transporter permease [Pseudomonadota bacterium]MBU1449585.1 branched-chain amino acid ABC transporter permease [Pseudomonadota bacterium]MBU2468362.1 branched-chain amino acid ABC transporter permease [Pseudomonadota bacterium]MBU2516882.1 branched-chain amino acid ABC transporter permease [Pseudomonadota bacterium]